MVHDHTNHIWMMVIACGGALLLILALPLIGLSQNWAAGIAVTAMVIVHLWMMKGHSDHNHPEHNQHKGGTK